jgi:hypothetical protein
MRLLTDDMVHEIKLRLNETKSIRNKVLLKHALKALTELKSLNEKKL